MSKKIFIFTALILVSFMYWCSTEQNNSDFQCTDNWSCNQEVSADNGIKSQENSDLENENEATVAGDNDGPMWWMTISSSDEEL